MASALQRVVTQMIWELYPSKYDAYPISFMNKKIILLCHSQTGKIIAEVQTVADPLVSARGISRKQLLIHCHIKIKIKMNTFTAGLKKLLLCLAYLVLRDNCEGRIFVSITLLLF